MFILDSLMIAGLRWVLDTTRTAAEAEMNDDTVLRERLLEAEMQREMGEISDEEFRATEADLLARIREIKERREGAGPLAFGAEALDTSSGSTLQVEAELSGDFHAPDERAPGGRPEIAAPPPVPRRVREKAGHAVRRGRTPAANMRTSRPAARTTGTSSRPRGASGSTTTGRRSRTTRTTKV